MEIIQKLLLGLPEMAVVVAFGLVYFPLLVYITAAHVVDYRILKNYYMKKRSYGLNISCGDTDGGGVNADVVERDVRNFVLVDDIYRLPFRDKQFESAVCSHTMEHVDDPERFFSELSRVADDVTVFLPPLWDFFSMLAFQEHKWQFLTMRSMHVNGLPRKVRLPYWSLQRLFGQKKTC